MTIFGKDVGETPLGKIQRILGGATEITVKTPEGGEHKEKLKDFRKELSEDIKGRGGVKNPDTFEKKVLKEDFGLADTSKNIGIRKKLREEYFPKENK